MSNENKIPMDYKKLEDQLNQLTSIINEVHLEIKLDEPCETEILSLIGEQMRDLIDEIDSTIFRNSRVLFDNDKIS